MKLESPQIMLPWDDTTSNRQYSRLDFKGIVDVRRVKRTIRRFCVHHLGTHCTDQYIMYHVKRWRELNKLRAEHKTYLTNKAQEDFISALEMSDDEYNAALLEADSQAATSVQDDGGPREAEREVSVVQSEPDEDGTQEPVCGP